MIPSVNLNPKFCAFRLQCVRCRYAPLCPCPCQLVISGSRYTSYSASSCVFCPTLAIPGPCERKCSKLGTCSDYVHWYKINVVYFDSCTCCTAPPTIKSHSTNVCLNAQSSGCGLLISITPIPPKCFFHFYVYTCMVILELLLYLTYRAAF